MIHSAILIEDNITIRDELASALLDLADMRVTGFARTASEGISLCAQPSGWDLAVIDLFLKQGSGLEVLQSLRTRNRNQRVVVLSNYATADIRSRCHALGSDAVYDKSTELDAFFAYCVGAFPNPDADSQSSTPVPAEVLHH